MSSFKLPPYRPTKFSKQWVYKKLGKAENTIALLDIDEKTFRNWGKHIPAPYADRLWLSNWGEQEIRPRVVSLEDALVIFKDFNFLAKHFGKRGVWKYDSMSHLPEAESAYMIRHFHKFVRIY